MTASSFLFDNRSFEERKREESEERKRERDRQRGRDSGGAKISFLLDNGNTVTSKNDTDFFPVYNHITEVKRCQGLLCLSLWPV